jgi:hypothetical protein
VDDDVASKIRQALAGGGGAQEGGAVQVDTNKTRVESAPGFSA